VWRLGWTELSAATPAATADPSTALRSGRDDKGERGYFPEVWQLGWTELSAATPAATADPSTPLRSGRDDKGERVFSGSVATWMDGAENRYSVETAGPSTALRSGRDDKGRGADLVEVVSGWGETECRATHYTGEVKSW
jgi:hypothetical protein